MSTAEEQAYDLEVFFNKLFANAGLRLLAPFRLNGSQIVGSFMLDNLNYKMHVFWQYALESFALEEIAEHKQENSRFLVVSLKGFTEQFKTQLSTKPDSTLVAVDLRDIFFVLDGGLTM